ncbi:chemotaxis protein [Prosthecodimorpha staleyi]|uniref:Chemotaxis protein n=1 Tax=Prosthecodimorpha staleyi TaxID=2840188 RepID=A0A947GIS9_9HYPH|nr:chemotaxis protein [Prosthecodimorpha staleyi]MBT9290224.1 chemotaxis protein [Prosthecodimorpha staleyi]
MQGDGEVTGLPIEDYQAIEDAVMETARGRWFLAEYARRHRAADTDAIVSSIERLERVIKRDRQVPDIDRIKLDLADMAEAIQRTKAEIAQMQLETVEGGRFAQASNELDAIVSQTEDATETILSNTERVQEIAWTLREDGIDGALCDRLDSHATEIYTACSFQDLTGQRTRKVVTVLRYLESRIGSMMSIWGMGDIEDMPVNGRSAEPCPGDLRPDAHLLNGPALAGEGIEQSAVDDILDMAIDALPEPAGPADETAAPLADCGPAAEFDDRQPSMAAPVRLSSTDFEVGSRQDYATIDDDMMIVVPIELEFVGADEPDVFARAPLPRSVPPMAAHPANGYPANGHPAAEAATEASLLAAADVFAVPIPPGEAPSDETGAPEEPTDRIAPAADVFAAAAEEAAAREPRPRPSRIAAPATLGNVAFALEIDVEPAAPAAEPVFALVRNEDPIARLTPTEKLIVFG